MKPFGAMYCYLYLSAYDITADADAIFASCLFAAVTRMKADVNGIRQNHAAWNEKIKDSTALTATPV